MNTALYRLLDAGVWQRFIAYTADCVILFGGLAVSQALLYPVNPLMAMLRRGEQPTGLQLHSWVFATVCVPFWLYFTWTQSSDKQATPGMRVMKLKLTDVQGGRVGFGQAALQSGAMLIPFELNHAVLFHLAQDHAMLLRHRRCGRATQRSG